MMENVRRIATQSQIHGIISRKNTGELEERAITEPEERAIATIINQIRAVQGWGVLSARDLEAVTTVWWREFARHRIPVEQYQELFRRAFDARAKALAADDRNPPAIDAVALVSHWVGEHGLNAELYRRRVESRRALSAAASGNCERCYGAGMEIISGRGARLCSCRRRPEVVSVP